MQEIWDTERQFSEIWGYKLQSSTGWLDSEGFKSTGTTEWVAGSDITKTVRNNVEREQKRCIASW